MFDSGERLPLVLTYILISDSWIFVKNIKTMKVILETRIAGLIFYYHPRSARRCWFVCLCICLSSPSLSSSRCIDRERLWWSHVLQSDANPCDKQICPNNIKQISQMIQSRFPTNKKSVFINKEITGAALSP